MVEIDIPYFHVRPRTPSEAGVVVIHEGSGMTLQLLRLCERLAGEGFAVVAPDLFFRTGGPGRDDFMAQMGAMTTDEILTDLGAAADVLRAGGAKHVGVIGFCMGGRYAWHAAMFGDGYDAAAAFYGSDIVEKLGTPRCPTLVFFGGSDPFIPVDNVAKVVAHHPDTIVYAHAGHGFMRDGSDDYVPDAAADAWERTVSHLRTHLQ